MTEKNNKSKLILISGASGSIGAEFLSHFQKQEEWTSIGLSRTISSEINKDFETADLYKRESIRQLLLKIDIANYSEIVYLHCIGLWDFEEIPPENPNTIFIKSNVTSFKNISSVLIDILENTCNKNNSKITFCSFGSIADKYNVKYYRSSSMAKKRLKEEIIILTQKYVNIFGVFINLSTLKIKKEIDSRPYSENFDYWLTPEQMVLRCFEKLLIKSNKFTEYDVYNPLPNFNDEFFTDEVVYKRRMNEKYGR